MELGIRPREHILGLVSWSNQQVKGYFPRFDKTVVGNKAISLQCDCIAVMGALEKELSWAERFLAHGSSENTL